MRLDTSNDEAMARQLQDSLPTQMETEGDGDIAGRLQERMRDEESRERDRLDELLARRLKEEERERHANITTYNNPYPYPLSMDALTDRFGIMNLHPIRRRLPHPFLTAPPVLQGGREIGYGNADYLWLPSHTRYAEEEDDEEEDFDGPFSSANDGPGSRFGNSGGYGQGYGEREGRGRYYRQGN